MQKRVVKVAGIHMISSSLLASTLLDINVYATCLLECDHLHRMSALAPFAYLEEGRVPDRIRAIRELDEWDFFAPPKKSTPPFLAHLGAHFLGTARRLRVEIDGAEGDWLWRVHSPGRFKRVSIPSKTAPDSHKDGMVRIYKDGSFAAADVAFVLNCKHVYRITVDALMASQVLAGSFPAVTYISPESIET